MLFKNATFFNLTKEFVLDDLEELLQSRTFVPCSGLKPSSFGWVPVIPGTDFLSYELNHFVLMTAKREEKVIPASALKEAIDAKVQKIEELEDRKLRPREKRSIKENTFAELLPRALPKSRVVQGYIDTLNHVLIINSTSAKDVDLFINCIRDSIGTFMVIPPQVLQKPSDMFTQWLLNGKIAEHFRLGSNCDLLDLEDRSTVVIRHQDLDLDATQVRPHLQSGMRCQKLQLLNEDLTFTIDKDLILSQMKQDSIMDDFDDEDQVAKFDADFITTTLILKDLYPLIFKAMGGSQKVMEFD